MIKIIVSVFAIIFAYYLTSVLAINRVFTCPKEDGLFPDTESCEKYYECKQWNAFKRNCKINNTYWNTETLSCEPIETTNCDPDNPFRCPLPYGTFADLSTCEGFYSCRANRFSKHRCQKGLHFNANDETCDLPQYVGCQLEPNPKICINPNEPVFDERRCNCYFECDENLVPIPKCCEDGLVWSQLGRTCDEPSIVNCGSSIKCLKPDHIFYHPTDCTKYIQCFYNIPIVESCQSGLHFNPNSNICELSPNAECIEMASSTQLATEKPSEPTTASQANTLTETQTEGPVSGGTEGPVSDGTEGSTSGGTEGSTSGGTEASTSGGTEGSTSGGTEGSTSDGTEGSTSGGTEASTSGGTEGSTSGGTEGPVSGGTESPVSSGTEGPVNGGTEDPTSDGTEDSVSSGTEGSTSGGTEASTGYSTNGLTDGSTPDPTDEPESTTKSQTCYRDSEIDLDWDNDCSDSLSGYSRPRPNSNDKYILCKNGIAQIVKCSPGLIFDASKLTCDYKGLVEQELNRKSEAQEES